jgi:hypothetical protein
MAVLKSPVHALRIALLAGAAIATAASCSDGIPTNGKPPSQKVVQIAAVTVDSLTINCTDPQGGFEQIYHLNFGVEMINTTDDDVTVTDVSSTGFIAASTMSGDTGPALTFPTLTFSPTPALVRAHDGDLVVHIPMTVGCGTAVVTAPFTRTLVTNLRITTNSGQYNTVPINITGNWIHAELKTNDRE